MDAGDSCRYAALHGVDLAPLNLVNTSILIVNNVVQVLATVIPILHRSGIAVTSQLFEVQIVNDHGFDIRIALGGYGVTRKFEIGWRKNPGLGVVDVSIFDEGQIAGTTRYGDV